MFTYEKFEVYIKAKELNKAIFTFLMTNKHIDQCIQYQIKRASLSIVLNIAEGSGRSSLLERKHFYTYSRGSAFEVSAALGVICDLYPQYTNEVKTLNSSIENIAYQLHVLIEKIKADHRK